MSLVNKTGLTKLRTCIHFKMLEADSLRELVPMITTRIAKVGHVPGFVVFEGSEKVLCEVYFATSNGVPTIKYFDLGSEGAQMSQYAPIASYNTNGNDIWEPVVGQDVMFV